MEQVRIKLKLILSAKANGWTICGNWITKGSTKIFVGGNGKCKN